MRAEDSQGDPRMGESRRRPQSEPSRRAPLRVADTIVDTLVSHGIDRVFGIPGGAISPVTDALLDSPIEHVTCQHESMAMYAAAGYARATGRPAVVMVTSGPGVLNALTGLAAAYLDECPILLLVGDVATTSEGRGALQDGSERGLQIVRMAEPVTRLAASLQRPVEARRLLLRAFRVLRSAAPGPVLLRLPVDHTRAVSWSETLEPEYSENLAPDEKVCRAIAESLGAARRPALFVGGGAGRSGAAEELVRLAEWTHCPVITDLEAKGVFPESHPLSFGIFGVGGTGRATHYLEGEVDLLVTLGARLDDTTTANYSPLLRHLRAVGYFGHSRRVQ